ncbi:MAG: hypothetical protein QM778_23860 [Myxococcales bacterium]
MRHESATRMRVGTIVTGALIACCALGPVRALAEPSLLELGHQASIDAEFDRALMLFDEALGDAALSRVELLTLLEERVLVLHALGKLGDLRRDLRALAALEPGRELGRRAPPTLVALFHQLRAETPALQLTLECTPSSDGYRIHASVLGAETFPDSRLRINYREAGGSYRSEESAEVALAHPALPLSYFAEVLGMGQVVLLSEGSGEAPRVLVEQASPKSELARLPAKPTREASSEVPWWQRQRGWLIGGSAAVVAASAVVLGVLLARDQNAQRTAVDAKVEF